MVQVGTHGWRGRRRWQKDPTVTLRGPYLPLYQLIWLVFGTQKSIVEEVTF